MKKINKFIPIAKPDLSGNEKKYLIECVETSWVSSRGPFVKKLEKNFADYLKVKYVAAVSSGTSGLHLALLALGIGPGDEVIVPTLTFIATVNAVKYVGAKPVFIDSEEETWSLDVKKLKSVITPKTKAIIPVHLYGHPVDMDPLIKIAKKNKIFIVEDAAEAHGAEYKGKKVGTFGDIAVFSLFGNKVITSGEGGLVATNYKNIDLKVRLYRDQGLTKADREKFHYRHPVIGYNYGMSNLQAAVAVAQLERIDEFIRKKREIAKIYKEYLGNIEGITLSPEKSWAKNIFWMFSLVLTKEMRVTRDQLIQLLKRKGIETRPFFYPIHTLPPYNIKKTFPIAEKIAARGLNLPSSVLLKENEIKYVCQTIKSFFK